MGNDSDMSFETTSTSIYTYYSLPDEQLALINNKDLSDICFLVGDSDEKKKIYGHKFLLAIGSPVFKSMFYGDLAEKSDLITIPDITVTGFMNMIRYIYGEKMKFDLSELFETYLAGNKYLVHNLCDIIETYLCDNLNDENKALIYDQLVKIKLVNSSIDNDFLDDVRFSIGKLAFNNSYFNKISEETLIEILSMECLDLDEYDIIKSCLNWINSFYLETEDKKRVFKRILPYLNLWHLGILNLTKIKNIDLYLDYVDIAKLFLFLADPYIKKYPFQIKTKRRKPLSISCELSNSNSYDKRSFEVPLTVNHDISIRSIKTSLPSELKNLTIQISLGEEVLKPNISKIFRDNKLILVFPDGVPIKADFKYEFKFTFDEFTFTSKSLSEVTVSEFDYKPNTIRFDYNVNLHCLEEINFFFNIKKV